MSESVTQHHAFKWRASAMREEADRLAVEEPLEIRLGGRRFTLTMRTPGHDEELAAGFLLAEGFINARSELGEIRRLRDAKGALDPNAIDVVLNVPAAGLRERLKRNFVVSSSCGICGKTSIEALERRIAPLSSTVAIALPALLRLPALMREAQAVFAATGGLHAAALFSLDAFAGGFVVQSLLALWLFRQFDLSLGAAGVFFFCSSLLSSLSFPIAAWLAKRIGLVNTMVFTHIPSSICLIAVAFSSNLTVVLALLLVRSALSQMDVPTRSSYVMAVVTPAERTAAASVTAVPRSLASSVSPAIAGFMLAGPFSGLPLVMCGCLKIAYDVALLGMFRHTKPPEEA